MNSCTTEAPVTVQVRRASSADQRQRPPSTGSARLRIEGQGDTTTDTNELGPCRHQADLGSAAGPGRRRVRRGPWPYVWWVQAPDHHAAAPAKPTAAAPALHERLLHGPGSSTPGGRCPRRLGQLQRSRSLWRPMPAATASFFLASSGWASMRRRSSGNAVASSRCARPADHGRSPAAPGIPGSDRAGSSTPAAGYRPSPSRPPSWPGCQPEADHLLLPGAPVQQVSVDQHRGSALPVVRLL